MKGGREGGRERGQDGSPHRFCEEGQITTCTDGDQGDSVSQSGKSVAERFFVFSDPLAHLGRVRYLSAIAATAVPGAGDVVASTSSLITQPSSARFATRKAPSMAKLQLVDRKRSTSMSTVDENKKHYFLPCRTEIERRLLACRICGKGCRSRCSAL